MTQIEFDTLMGEIRQEQQQNNDLLRAELAEIEARRVEARKEFDDAHDIYKAVCVEIEQKQKQLREVNAQYYERKKALIKAFPKAIGVRKEDNSRKKGECFAIRAKIIAELKECFKDSSYIDVDHIDVHFNIDGEDVTFSAVIPNEK